MISRTLRQFPRSLRASRLPRPITTSPVRRYATYRRFDNSNTSFDWTRFLYNRNVLYAGIGLGTFYVYNLHEAPFTHRMRFIWVPYWLETIIGDMSYKQILSQYRDQLLPYTDPQYRRITTVMNKLLTVAINNSPDEKQVEHLKKLKWSVHVIHVDPTQVAPNAFILPNGKIFVFSSILPICRDNDGLATVLSHELSHQLAHHSLEQLSKQPFYMLLLALLFSITGTGNFNNLMIEGILKMPASREMESEADRIGCELMARLCFNIYEAVNFWARMNAWEQKQAGYAKRGMLVLEFFSTHPNTNKRIHDIQLWLPELEHIREMSNCHEAQLGLFNTTHRNFFGK